MQKIIATLSAGWRTASREQAQYPRYAPTAIYRQASRRQQGVDPQQAVL
jgi:hypothetical protein